VDGEEEGPKEGEMDASEVAEQQRADDHLQRQQEAEEFQMDEGLLLDGVDADMEGGSEEEDGEGNDCQMPVEEQSGVRRLGRSILHIWDWL
jgi:hypothetical protein